MSLIKRVVLDVLKPRQPNALEFASAIADQNNNCLIKVTVTAVDEKTESVVVTVDSDDISYLEIVEAITSLGGSVHSIDEVVVSSALRAEE